MSDGKIEAVAFTNVEEFEIARVANGWVVRSSVAPGAYRAGSAIAVAETAEHLAKIVLDIVEGRGVKVTT